MLTLNRTAKVKATIIPPLRGFDGVIPSMRGYYFGFINENIRGPFVHCQSGSFCQLLGNPIAETSTLGYLASKALTRDAKVF